MQKYVALWHVLTKCVPSPCPYAAYGVYIPSGLLSVREEVCNAPV